MKKTAGRALLFGFLILLSALIYYLHFLIFRDPHHIFIYLLGDIAFLPLEVLFVSLIFHKLLEDREKKNTFRKLNMIIGVFFSQIGNELMMLFIGKDPMLRELKDKLLFNGGWEKKEFGAAEQAIEKHPFNICLPDLGGLKRLLIENREFMMKTMENPILLEHELFSELTMAMFHLEEELSRRTHADHFGEKDREHIDNDISRVYKALMRQWILYVRHLKNEYPYLYSFAIRTNPFDENAKVEIV